MWHTRTRLGCIPKSRSEKAGKELLALRLGSIHNLRFILRLMENMREAILEDRFEGFRTDFMSTYKPTDEATRQEQKERWLKARGDSSP